MLREMIRVFSMLLGQRGVAVAVGALRMKALALMLGPEGLGLWSQAAACIESTRQVVMLGMGPGFVKLVAEYEGKGQLREIGTLVGTVLCACAAMSALGLIFVITTASRVSSWVFGSASYSAFSTKQSRSWRN